MKAIVLAAGIGTRLKSITTNIPKPMLRIAGEVILEHNLEWLRSYGIRDVYINLHYIPEVITDYFGDGTDLEINITYSKEEKILGTAGAVEKIARHWKEPFLVIYGDNFYPPEYNLSDLIEFHRRRDGLATIGLYRNKSEMHKSGVVILDHDNAIVEFIEKPGSQSGSSTQHMPEQLAEIGLINTGIYLLNSEINGFLPEGFSDFGKDIFPKLIGKKMLMYGYLFKNMLIAVDTVELYNRTRT